MLVKITGTTIGEGGLVYRCSIIGTKENVIYVASDNESSAKWKYATHCLEEKLIGSINGDMIKISLIGEHIKE